MRIMNSLLMELYIQCKYRYTGLYIYILTIWWNEPTCEELSDWTAVTVAAGVKMSCEDRGTARPKLLATWTTGERIKGELNETKTQQTFHLLWLRGKHAFFLFLKNKGHLQLQTLTFRAFIQLIYDKIKNLWSYKQCLEFHICVCA